MFYLCLPPPISERSLGLIRIAKKEMRKEKPLLKKEAAYIKLVGAKRLELPTYAV